MVLERFALDYHQCRDLSKANRFAESAGCWRTVVTRIQNSDPLWLVPWLLDQVGQLSAKSQRWNEMNRAYGEALDRTQNADPNIAARLMHSWLTLIKTQLNAGLTTQQNLAPGSLKVANALEDLANLSTVNGDVALAEQYFRDALAIREHLSPGSLSVAQSLDQLGDLLRLRGKLEEAEDYFQRALQIQEKIAPDTDAVATSLYLLGITALLRGDFASAEHNYNSALSIDQKVEPEGTSVATVLTGLASVEAARRDLVKAEQLATHALAIREKKLAHESLPVSESLEQVVKSSLPGAT